MSKIIIVGSGVFGLSSALHLVKAGYKDITIFDRLDLFNLNYSFENGADTASADINKVFRALYPGEPHYHRLALQARESFLKWDAEVRSCTPEEARAKFNIEGDLKIIEECGVANYTDERPELYTVSIGDFEKSGLRDTQYFLDNPEDILRAKSNGIFPKLNFFAHKSDLHGLYDASSGLLYANNACLYVCSFLKNHGVKFVTGSPEGCIESFIENDEGSVKGVITKDGKSHFSDLTIVASGPWTPSLVPQLGGLCEAQNGNVIVIKIPEERKDLIEKYSPKNFPLLMWKMEKELEGNLLSGIGIFPSTSKGLVKLILRQKKYNNPVKLQDGSLLSIPITSNSSPPEHRLSKFVVDQFKQFIRIFLPDLVQFGISQSKLLWYTDAINNDFIIDFAPEKKNLMVVTGGSGHGFKFLPVLGQFVVDVLENRENEYTKIFKWRDYRNFKDINHILSVKTGESSYYGQDLADESDLLPYCKI